MSYWNKQMESCLPNKFKIKFGSLPIVNSKISLMCRSSITENVKSSDNEKAY